LLFVVGAQFQLLARMIVLELIQPAGRFIGQRLQLLLQLLLPIGQRLAPGLCLRIQLFLQPVAGADGIVHVLPGAVLLPPGSLFCLLLLFHGRAPALGLLGVAILTCLCLFALGMGLGQGLLERHFVAGVIRRFHHAQVELHAPQVGLAVDALRRQVAALQQVFANHLADVLFPARCLAAQEVPQGAAGGVELALQALAGLLAFDARAAQVLLFGQRLFMNVARLLPGLGRRGQLLCRVTGCLLALLDAALGRALAVQFVRRQQAGLQLRQDFAALLPVTGFAFAEAAQGVLAAIVILRGQGLALLRVLAAQGLQLLVFRVDLFLGVLL